MFYSDITSKVTDLFEKGYAYKVPFTFKVDIKDKYFMNFVQKTEFAKDDKGLNLGWEYKFRYDRDGKMMSLLGAQNKVELEGEFLPKALRTEKGFAKFRAKSAISHNAQPVDGWKHCEYLNYWNIDSELESKFSYNKCLGHSIKFLFAPRCLVPKINFTTLFDHHPYFLGVNYTFNHESPLLTDTMEVLLGGRPCKGITTYLKHTTKGLKYAAGTIAAGFHGSKMFLRDSDAKDKKGVKKMEWKCPAELAAEASMDVTDCKKYGGKIASKVNLGRHYGFQTMFDSDLNLTSALTYTPKRGYKFIWSEQLNAGRFFRDTKFGLGYRYGFTFEIGIGSF